MASEWPLVSLGDVINLKRGYDLAARDRESGCVPIISSSGPTGTHSKAMVDAPGVVTGRYGTIGLVYYVEEPFWPLNTTLYVQDFKGNDPRFVYYLLKTISYRDYLDKAAVPGINRNDVHRAMVCLPPIHEQESIAATIHCLDIGIESHRAENETVEEIARAIFKSWFVDFDPVRAKAEGREPEGMDAVTAALFSSGFEESIFGPVPAGWNMGRLDDLLVLQRGFDLPNVERVPGPFPVIAASGPSGTHREYQVKGPGVVTGRSGVLGNVYWVDDDFWPLNTSLWIKEYKRATPAYALQHLRTLDLSSFNAGSAVPTLNRNHIHGLPTVVPPATLVQAFDEVATPLFESIRKNQKQAATLTDLRDTLLPRLISGKLRVPEAEKLVEAVL
jgi:type I restriction enzyme S subunit